MSLSKKATKVLVCCHTLGLEYRNRHPLEVLEGMGITWNKSQPQTICDQWWLFDVEGLPEPLPNFLTIQKGFTDD